MSRQRWQFALAGLLCTLAVTPISAAQLSVGQRGQASWYGEFHEGKLMANQRPFRMDEATVAHRTLPLGTLIEVRNLKNGRFVDAEVTDRGPYVRGRMLDVSKAVAEELEMLEGGTAAVEIRVIQPAVSLLAGHQHTSPSCGLRNAPPSPAAPPCPAAP